MQSKIVPGEALPQPFAFLPGGDRQFRYFVGLEPIAVAALPAGLPAFWKTLDATNASADSNWHIIYLAFEAGLASLDLPAPASFGLPLAAIWRSLPSQLPEQPPKFPNAIWKPTTNYMAYQKAFARVQQGIGDGEVYQLNLTLRARAMGAGWTAKTYQDLAPNAAVLLTPELSLWSASPECGIAVDGHGAIGTYPIKGTATAEQGAQSLLRNRKEHAEHSMVVDMCRNDLGRLCLPGSIETQPFMAPVSLSYAVHLESRVTGRLRPATSWSDILGALLPMASISGTPKRQACKLIADVESEPRGPYTGVLGWIAPDGSAYFSLLIRTAWQDAAGELWYGSGGGIVADSDCDREYKEILLKLRALGHAEPS